MPKRRIPRRQYVHELKEKLEGLAAAWPISMQQLYDESGVPKNSIQRAIGDENEERGTEESDSKLGGAHQKRVAEYFGFTVEWEQWRAHDENATEKRLDTAKAFLKRYRGEKPKKLNPRKRPEAGTDERETTVEVAAELERITTEPLKLGRRREPKAFLEGLGTVELHADQTGNGDSSLSFGLNCDEAGVEVSQSPIVLRYAVLIVTLGHARARTDSIKGRGTSGFEVDGGYGPVRCAWSGGTTSRLRYRLAATGSRIGSFTLERASLANVEQLAHGDVIKASLETWLKYIEVDDGELQESSIGVLDRVTGELKAQSAEERTVEQRRIIAHLAKLLLKHDDNNYAIVAEHEIEYVRR